jgi:hypothetical protein
MAEGSRMYMFEFRGRVEILKHTQGDQSPTNESQIVSHLNDNSTLIAQKIQQELIRGLSPSLAVQGLFRFKSISMRVVSS